MTFEGLEEDLLTKTVGIIRPDDEEQRSLLVEKIATNDNILAELESNILESLLNTENQSN